MQDIPSALLTRLREAPATLTAEECDLIATATSACARRPTPLLISQKEAAMLLGIDRTTVWRLSNNGILTPVEIAPGTMRYRREDIEKLARHGWRQLVSDRHKAA